MIQRARQGGAAHEGQARAEVAQLASSLRACSDLILEDVRLAFVLGSGLGAFADELEDAVSVPYDQLRGMPQSAVPGHAGRLVSGIVPGTDLRVLVQQGRVHYYEGLSAFDVTRCVRSLAAVGIKGLVLTNAAGGVNPTYEPGTLMRLRDHINLQGASGLYAGEGGPACVYDPAWGALLDGVAKRTANPLKVGVYVGNLGPAYETPAEVELARRLGGDAVGMSTVLEAASAAAAGMRVAAVSCITNVAASKAGAPLSHEEVMETGRAVAARFQRLLADATGPLVGALD